MDPTEVNDKDVGRKTLKSGLRQPWQERGLLVKIAQNGKNATYS